MRVFGFEEWIDHCGPLIGHVYFSSVYSLAAN